MNRLLCYRSGSNRARLPYILMIFTLNAFQAFTNDSFTFDTPKIMKKENNSVLPIHIELVKVFQYGIPCSSYILPQSIKNLEQVRNRSNEVMVGYCKVSTENLRLVENTNFTIRSHVRFRARKIKYSWWKTNTATKLNAQTTRREFTPHCKASHRQLLKLKESCSTRNEIPTF